MFCCFKQKTSYGVRISDWSSDVCSSDLGEFDRRLLEVVAEGEVAEHLEKGVVPGGVADVLEIVVLAAGADAFLRGGRAPVGPRLRAGEDVLELHHAGIGEEKRWIVARQLGRASCRERVGQYV